MLIELENEWRPLWYKEPEMAEKIKDIFVQVGSSPLLGSSPSLADLDVEVSEGRIRVSKMYDYVSYAFAELEALANLLGTKNIHFGDKWSRGGCETCDYGSSYSVEFSVEPEKEISLE